MTCSDLSSVIWRRAGCTFEARIVAATFPLFPRRNRSSVRRLARLRTILRPAIEAMETRVLLSANIPAPTPIVKSSAPSGADATTLAMDASGNIWFTDPSNNAIGKQTPSGTVTEYNLPTDEAWPDAIATAPNGNFWFVEDDADQIGRITPTGSISEFALPSDNSSPTAIVSGPSGDMWFVDEGTNEIGKITPAGKVTEYPIDSSLTLDGSITLGPDGNLWASAEDDSGNGLLLRMTATGQISSFSLPTTINDLTTGPDGNLWIAGDGEIDRVTTAGVDTSFSLSSGDSAFNIVSGPDGALWFATYGTNAIGRITTSGSAFEFDLPEGTAPASVSDLIAGNDGKLWYADDSGSIASLNVHNALLAGGADITATAGSPVTSTVASFMDLSGPSVTSDYQATIDWGDGTTSVGTIAANSSGGFDVTGTHTWSIGSSQVTVTITDARPAADDPGGLAGRTAVAYTSITAPAPPVQGTAVNINAVAGQLFNGVVANYTGVLLNSLSSYSATIDWGDGHISTGTIADNGQGGVSITGSNRYASSGSFTVTTSLSPFNIWPIVPIAGGAVPGASGSGVSGVPTTAVWGKPSTTVTVANSGASGSTGGGVSSPGTPIGVEPPISIIPIRWPFPGLNSVTGTATVAAGVMNGSGFSLLASSKTPFNGIVAHFTLTDPSTDLSHFHAIIDWQDPNTRDWFELPNSLTSTGTITSDGQGGFNVSATASFTQFGLFHYQVLISDDRLGSSDSAIVGAAYGQVIVDTPFRPIPLAAANGASASGSATSPNPALAEHPSVKPVAIHSSTNHPFNGNVAILKGINATNANLAQLQGSINWGDGSTPSAAQFVSGPKGEIIVRASHNFETGGKRSITVSLTQNISKGTSASDPPIALPGLQISAHVTGKAASAKYHATANPIAAVVGIPFQGTVGTLTGPALAAGQSLVATISWGDGSQSTGSISDDGSGWQIAGSHTFEKKGRRHIQVVVRLQASGSAQSHPVARFGTTSVISAS